MSGPDATQQLRRLWDRYASRYDRDTGFYDRFLLADSRPWICSQAEGKVLEVAVGSGRNLPFYPQDIELTGVDLSAGMLGLGRGRAARLDRRITLCQADAQRLPFDDDLFDTLVCTLGLSSIPDPAAAVHEMHRVLRTGGRLLVLGHVGSPNRIVRMAQRRLERLSLRLAGDHQTRHIYPLIVATGFSIERRERLRAGVIERIAATKRRGPSAHGGRSGPNG